eukprot:TRINITY_DN116623_c0_g1_i1.p1 TRINITY_DN116623_c0_g1~~TRINITY_DN116623_c0_g1_i1.p1  ORF type:complete len:209 (-),score=35.67 TRINITY_DN116623_c0_g1_i1:3-545(-)
MSVEAVKRDGFKLLERLRPTLAKTVASQELLLLHPDVVVDGLDLCMQIGGSSSSSAARPLLGESLSDDLLMARLFHLVCGGSSADWPIFCDDAQAGVSVAHPCTFARILGYLMARGGLNRKGRLLLSHAEMSICVIRRFLGVSAGDFLKNPAVDPNLPKNAYGATQESKKAATILTRRLL